jgi:hypothetical protein
MAQQSKKSNPVSRCKLYRHPFPDGKYIVVRFSDKNGISIYTLFNIREKMCEFPPTFGDLMRHPSKMDVISASRDRTRLSHYMDLSTMACTFGNRHCDNSYPHFSRSEFKDLVDILIYDDKYEQITVLYYNDVINHFYGVFFEVNAYIDYYKKENRATDSLKLINCVNHPSSYSVSDVPVRWWNNSQDRKRLCEFVCHICRVVFYTGAITIAYVESVNGNSLTLRALISKFGTNDVYMYINSSECVPLENVSLLVKLLKDKTIDPFWFSALSRDSQYHHDTAFLRSITNNTGNDFGIIAFSSDWVRDMERNILLTPVRTYPVEHIQEVMRWNYQMHPIFVNAPDAIYDSARSEAMYQIKKERAVLCLLEKDDMYTEYKTTKFPLVSKPTTSRNLYLNFPATLDEQIRANDKASSFMDNNVRSVVLYRSKDNTNKTLVRFVIFEICRGHLVCLEARPNAEDFDEKNIDRNIFCRPLSQDVTKKLVDAIGKEAIDFSQDI